MSRIFFKWMLINARETWSLETLLYRRRPETPDCLLEEAAGQAWLIFVHKWPNVSDAVEWHA